MQLKKKPAAIRQTLAVATASLLGGVAQNANALETSSDWEIDSALLFYAESDRIALAEPVVRVRKDMGNDRFLTVKLVIDALTGSSANGAIPTASPQTFTTPSGNGTYTTQANEVPLDPGFRDTRGAVNADWELPLGENLTGIFGFNFSNEFDYQSVGLSATLNWETSHKMTTWTLGVGFNADTVKPVGGVPVGLTNMPVLPAIKATEGADHAKDVQDLVLGWSRVLSRRDLLQLSLGYGNESGYLSDPYKILTVVDGATGAPVADPAQRYRYEKRPRDRTRQSRWYVGRTSSRTTCCGSPIDTTLTTGEWIRIPSMCVIVSSWRTATTLSRTCATTPRVPRTSITRASSTGKAMTLPVPTTAWPTWSRPRWD